MFENFAIFLVVVLIGWICGLFVNYIGDILPARRRIQNPMCLYCESPMAWLNYLIWPRKCFDCGKHRSKRTWIIEVVYIGISLWLWYYPPSRLGFAISLCLLVYFGIVTIIDIEHKLILNITSLVGVFLGFSVGVYLHGLVLTLLGGIAGFLAMLSLYLIGFGFMRIMGRWRGQKVEEEALGFGDVNLCGIIGLILGWPGIVAGLVLTILIAGFASLFFILTMYFMKRYKPNLALPYGPFLVAAAIFLLFIRGNIAGF